MATRACHYTPVVMPISRILLKIFAMDQDTPEQRGAVPVKCSSVQQEKACLRAQEPLTQHILCDQVRAQHVQ